MHFTAVGDFSAGGNASAVLNKIDELDSDLTQTLGDLSYGTSGRRPTWCKFVTDRVGEGYPFQLLSGNHEAGGQNGNINDFSACLPNQLPGAVGTYGRQYYVDVPADDPLVRFVNISPDLIFPDGTWSYGATSARYTWTAAAIDGARSAGVPWVVVSMHKPCLTTGNYACDPGAALYNMLLSKKVDLILSGHEHTYQRSHQLSLSAGCPALVPTTFDADCVADSGSSFVKGVGSVIGVVGTGGVGFYNVNSADPEAGYFSVLSGANANPTMGVLDVSATENQLRADFVAAAGGNQSDTFTITRGAANTPPVAAFTSTCTELACTFDGSGSSDPDGSIAGYAWNFGDGSTGTGANATHTYATAGTYPVALTVTDNGGAPNTLTRNVTVTGGGTTTTYVSDQFSRTVASGFGTAPVGGTWTHSTALSNFSVNGTQGRIRVAAGSGPAAYLASTNAPNADVKTSFSLDKVPTGNGLYVTVVGRRTASAGLYCAEARVTSTGAVALELCRRSASGTETVVQAAVTVPGTYAVGETLNLRLQVTGTSPTTLRAKVWESGTAEPATWQRSATDTTAGLQTAGSVGITPYLSSSATNSPVTLQVDELTVTAP